MNQLPPELQFPARHDQALAVAHVNVIPMDTPAVLGDRTVVIRDGRISLMGPAAEIPTDGLEVINGSGKFLMPGLADMHVHYWDAGEFGMFLANGVTSVRNMWGSPFHLALQRRVEAGEFPGPRVVTTSPIIDGPGPEGNTIWPGSSMAATPEQAESLVRTFAERGYKQIKVYSWLSLPELQALGRASKETGLRMVGHCPDSVTYEESIAAGMTCFEHLTNISKERLTEGRSLAGLQRGSVPQMEMIAHHLDIDSVRRLAHDMARDQIWNCTTLVVWQGMGGDLAAAMSNPLLRYERRSTVTSWNPANDFRFRSHTTDQKARLAASRARNETYLRVISVLHEEGAPILLGTDTPNPFVFQGFSIHNELDNFVRAGLSPYEAIRCGTTEAARFLDETDWGSIATGNRADLVLLAANPLLDISALRHPEIVFVNGFVLHRADLDALLRQRELSVSVEASVAEVSLAPTDQAASVLDEGELVERLVDGEISRTAYRHQRSENGGWLIEEAHAEGADGLRTAGGTWRSRIELSPELSVVGAEQSTETFLGTERYDIARGSDGEYTIRSTEIDGWEQVTRLTGPLLPSDDIALSAILLLLREGGFVNDTVNVLSLLNGSPDRIPVQIVREDDDGNGSSVFRVTVRQPGTSHHQTYRFAPDGTFVSRVEMTWRGESTVVPGAAT